MAWALTLTCTRQMREEMGWTSTSEGELAAFVAYAQASQPTTQSAVRNRHRGVQAHEVAPGAQAFPSNFTALVDTYDTIKSGARDLGATSHHTRPWIAPGSRSIARAAPARCRRA